MKVFIIDVAKCNGCYSCQIACKDEHVGNDWPPFALSQPDTGHFWLKLEEKTHGSVPKVKVAYTAKPCMHCDSAPCILAGGDAVYKREDGLVIIDPEKAKGKKELLDSCPYDAIFWNEELNLPQKCTGCAHLVGEGRPPRCVEVCPTDALSFGEEEEFGDLILKAEVMLPEAKTKPRVYYLNLPYNFLAAAIFDPLADECIEGATVILTNQETGKKETTLSDDFGDFWFKRLKPATYSIQIQKEGYLPLKIDDIKLEESLNLGDLALNKIA